MRAARPQSAIAKPASGRGGSRPIAPAALGKRAAGKSAAQGSGRPVVQPARPVSSQPRGGSSAAGRPISGAKKTAVEMKPSFVQAKTHAVTVSKEKRAKGGKGAASPKPSKSMYLKGAASGAATSVLEVFRGSSRVFIGVIIGVVALVVLGLVLVYSSIFAATDFRVRGSEHVSQEAAEQLIRLPEGTTLLNVDEDRIVEALKQNPWVSGVKVERQFPHTLTVSPRERKVASIVYISSDNIAWAIGDDSHWIAPVSLSVTVDKKGNVVEGEDAQAKGTKQITGPAAAQALAKHMGAALMTGITADANPESGADVTSEEVLACLKYVQTFSPDFLDQVKQFSVTSTEAISAILTNGVEVSLGVPDNIDTKERVITQLLEQEEGVTFINVRTPDAYTFRSVPE